MAILPGSVVTTTYDTILLMFCYPWFPRDRRVGAVNDPAVRFPRAENLDQSTSAYGQRTFTLAGQYGIDAMVGFWTIAVDSAGRVQIPSVYDNFIRSVQNWPWGQTAVPRIALNMSFTDPTRPEVVSHIQEVRRQMALPRYHRFRDAQGRERLPVAFWGIEPLLPFVPQRVVDLGKRLAELKAPVGGALPFLIWEGGILDVWALQAMDKNHLFTHVLSRVDAFYEHACHIPGANVLKQPMPDWRQFPRYQWDQVVEDPQFPNKTLHDITDFVKDIRLSTMRSVRQRHPGAPPYVFISGTMPQYCRERMTQASRDGRTIINQARVICTDPVQFELALHVLRDRSTPLIEVETTPDQISITQMFSLTSWAEWAEGSTFEPVGSTAPGYEEALYGIADTTGDRLLSIVKRKLG
ncbi:MAG TPA: hypothetical protein VGD79_03915, partial [Thermoanaerobaculia bacterium]